MPLPGIVPEPPIRDKVRIGIKENGRPKSTNCFHSDDKPFIDKLGTPRKLSIHIPFDTADKAFKDGMELWVANQTLKCWSADAKEAHRLDRQNQYQDVECKYIECQQYTQGNCKPIGRLKFEIPEIGPGLFIIETKGWASIKGLWGALESCQDIRTADWELGIVARKNQAKQTYHVIQLTQRVTV